jgi:hypothetical protein
MKTIALLSVTLLLFSSFSCKKATDVSAIVIKDCTGVYLRVNESDYRVCNSEKLDDYDDAAKVNAAFKLAGETNCRAKEDIVCMMLHEYKDWIVVTHVE